MVLHHNCEFRPCVNPDHVEMLTHKEHGAHAYERSDFIRIPDNMSDRRFREVLDKLFNRILWDNRKGLL